MLIRDYTSKKAMRDSVRYVLLAITFAFIMHGVLIAVRASVESYPETSVLKSSNNSINISTVLSSTSLNMCGKDIPYNMSCLAVVCTPIRMMTVRVGYHWTVFTYGTQGVIHQDSWYAKSLIHWWLSFFWKLDRGVPGRLSRTDSLMSKTIDPCYVTDTVRVQTNTWEIKRARLINEHMSSGSYYHPLTRSCRTVAKLFLSLAKECVP